MALPVHVAFKLQSYGFYLSCLRFGFYATADKAVVLKFQFTNTTPDCATVNNTFADGTAASL
jgi:hypothetical protein